MAPINSLCAQLFGFCAAVSGYLHLLWVFNVSCPETRAPWWSSLAALPSTGRGMCWSWRSVRTTHHLEPRNMWWAFEMPWRERARSRLRPGWKKKKKKIIIIWIYFWKFVIWNLELFFSFMPKSCEWTYSFRFSFFLFCLTENHIFLSGSIFSQGPIKVTVQELDGSFKHTLQIEENSLKHDIPCHSKSRR